MLGRLKTAVKKFVQSPQVTVEAALKDSIPVVYAGFKVDSINYLGSRFEGEPEIYVLELQDGRTVSVEKSTMLLRESHQEPVK